MTLAARHRAVSVLSGAVAAFALLNLLAVVFGAAVAAFLPARLVSAGAAALFAAFGIHALMQKAPDQGTQGGNLRRILLSTFAMIILAEFGDKTQIAVAGLSCTAGPLPVWVGATAALTLTTAMGVAAGRTLLQRIPIRLFHRISGAIFLALAAAAAVQALFPPQGGCPA
jgi:putative Ca2+/H+ antiporter (TMEM165/GDT1 family)